MVNVFDVDPNELIEKASIEIAKMPDFKPPAWATFVKTGVFKQRPPSNKDWWYTRVTAILRAIYKLGPVGVAKLRTKYGGKMNMGVAPEHFMKASGSIVRKAVQQLEKAGFVKQVDAKGHKGRLITGKGKSFLDKLATQIYKATPKDERVLMEIKTPPPRVHKEKPIAAEALENPKDLQAPENTKRSPGKTAETAVEAEAQAEQ